MTLNRCPSPQAVSFYCISKFIAIEVAQQCMPYLIVHVFTTDMVDREVLTLEFRESGEGGCE